MSDDTYAFGQRLAADCPPHIEGCEVQAIEKDGREVVGILACQTGCPILQRSLDRGRELAEEHGWS